LTTTRACPLKAWRGCKWKREVRLLVHCSELGFILGSTRATDVERLDMAVLQKLGINLESISTFILYAIY